MRSDKQRNKENGKKALKGLIKFVVIPVLLLIFLDWKVGLSFLGLVLLAKFIKVKRRKYFAKDLEGNEVGFKGYLKRWKLGIEGITPVQQAKTSLLGNWIVLSGILAGIIINAIVRMSNQWYWIETILVGSLILVVIQMIGGFQKYWRFKAVEEGQKKIEESLNGKEEEVVVYDEAGNFPEENIKKLKMEKLA